MFTVLRKFRGVGFAAIAAMVAVPQLADANVAAAPSEFWNGFYSYPANQDSTDFEVTFTGNQTDYIDLPSPTDTNLDPWGNGNVRDSYNPATNLTTVSYNGATSDPPFAQSISGQPAGVVHFGLGATTSSGSGVGWGTFAGAYWTGDTAGATTGPSEPVMDLQPNFTVPIGPANFAVWFLEGTVNGNKTGQWFEFPISSGTSPSFILTNPNSGTMTFDNAGYFLSPTEIPLENLNWPGEPPPGVAGSPFAMLPVPQPLAAGASEPVTTPEPAAIAFMAAAGVLILAIRRRRSAR
jgi:hypothetical protein